MDSPIIESEEVLREIILRHVIDGGLVRGIKMHRKYTGSGLKDAKEWIEKHFPDEIAEYHEKTNIEELRNDSEKLELVTRLLENLVPKHIYSCYDEVKLIPDNKHELINAVVRYSDIQAILQRIK